MSAPVPVAWLQLTKEPLRLGAAVAGIAFAVILMLVQLGFEEALLTSSGIHLSSLHADLVLVSPEYQYVVGTSHFSERQLFRAFALSEVASVDRIYVAPVPLKNPAHRSDRAILTLGVAPVPGILNLPAVDQSVALLRDPDTALFDERCRPEFATLPADFRQGLPAEAEIAGRKIRIVGLFSLGTSFGVDGNIIVSDQEFLRIFPYRSSSEVDLGLVRLKPGSDPEAARVRLEHLIGPDVKVFTHSGIVARERSYWATNTPVGVVFKVGLIMGLFVGLIIVYQILYADVTDHLREYATLKAIGYRDHALAWIVVQQAVILSVFGFIPGVAISQAVYRAAASATLLPLEMTPAHIAAVYGLTLGMCALSGLLAARRLRSADPAEIF
jgi:putative ABC transport system permease protein